MAVRRERWRRCLRINVNIKYTVCNLWIMIWNVADPKNGVVVIRMGRAEGGWDAWDCAASHRNWYCHLIYDGMPGHFHKDISKLENDSSCESIISIFGFCCARLWHLFLLGLPVVLGGGLGVDKRPVHHWLIIHNKIYGFSFLEPPVTFTFPSLMPKLTIKHFITFLPFAVSETYSFRPIFPSGEGRNCQKMFSDREKFVRWFLSFVRFVGFLRLFEGNAWIDKGNSEQ